MQLPDFIEFINSISQEDMNFINGLNENTDSFPRNLANREDFLQFIGFISGKNFGMSLRLLQRYHEWLEKQLLNQ